MASVQRLVGGAEPDWVRLCVFIHCKFWVSWTGWVIWLSYGFADDEACISGKQFICPPLSSFCLYSEFGCRCCCGPQEINEPSAASSFVAVSVHSVNYAMLYDINALALAC